MCLERAWSIDVRCEACGARARWSMDQVATLPAAATLGDVAGRLRCRSCGSAEAVLSTRNGRWHPGMAGGNA